MHSQFPCVIGGLWLLTLLHRGKLNAQRRRIVENPSLVSRGVEVGM